MAHAHESNRPEPSTRKGWLLVVEDLLHEAGSAEVHRHARAATASSERFHELAGRVCLNVEAPSGRFLQDDADADVR